MPKIALAGLGPAHILSMASSWRTTALRHATFAAILALVRFGPNSLGDDYDFCHETSCNPSACLCFGNGAEKRKGEILYFANQGGFLVGKDQKKAKTILKLV